MKKILLIALTAVFSAGTVPADVVYVTSKTPGCTDNSVCPNANNDGTYVEHMTLGNTGIKGSAPGRPVTPNFSRAYLGSADVTSTDAGVDVMPVLEVPGGIYQIDYNFNSAADNVSTDVIMSASAIGGTLSFSETDIFQRKYGVASQWQFVGHLTNDVENANPVIQFRYQSGTINASTQNRILFDAWRFTLVEPCLDVPAVTTTGPVSADKDEVVVMGVSGSAAAVTVYQDTGAGMVQIGSKTSDIVEGINSVPVSGLVQGAHVAATQTVGDQEGCQPPPGSGVVVGGGANPSVRVALTLRETNSEGPIGADGDITQGPFRNLHFLGASKIQGGAPVDARVIEPDTEWQTVTFPPLSAAETVGDVDAGTAVFEMVAGQGYAPEEWSEIKIHAYRTAGGVRIYSENPASGFGYSPDGQSYNVNVSWQPVEGAEGYRLLRDLNGLGEIDHVDVAGTSYADANTGWTPGDTVTPKAWPTAIQWNGGSVGSLNNIGTSWCTLESINFAIHDVDDTGPFDIFIDNIQNGDTVFQTFEEAQAGTANFGFRVPDYSGTTRSHILGGPSEGVLSDAGPNVGVVSDAAADSGQNSFRVRFQWAGGAPNRWLRLTTHLIGNPLVDVTQPITFRMLLLPVGAAPPSLPVISVSRAGGDIQLSWTGTFVLEAADEVNGTYQEVSGVTGSSHLVTPTDDRKFYRLRGD